MNATNAVSTDVDNATSDVLLYSSEHKAPVPFAVLVSFFILVPNFLVLFTLLRAKNLRNNRRIDFILWLSFSDFLSGVTSALFAAINNSQELKRNISLCLFVQYMLETSTGMSLAQGFLVCFDRCLGVTRNFIYQKLKRKYRYLFMFVVALIVNIFVSFWTYIYFYPQQVNFCSVYTIFGENTYTMLKIMGFFYAFLIVLICVFYLAAVTLLRRKLRFVHVHISTVESTQGSFKTDGSNSASSPRFLQPRSVPHQRESSNKRNKLEKNIAITTGIIVVVLILFNGPYTITLVLEGFNVLFVTRSLRVYVGGLAFLQSAINPWLYAWRIHEFRKEIWLMFSWCQWPQ